MQNQQETKYFDLHTAGIGYINRFRQVSPKQGQSFYSCTIGALRGNTDNAQYTYFDCRIVNEEALNVLLNFIDEDDKNAKVIAGFKIGDIYPEIFTYSKGKNQGTQGVMLKGRLIKLDWLKINNELVYQYESKPETVIHSEPESPETDVQTEVMQHEKAKKFAKAELPNMVKLDRNDPDFNTKKSDLKARGYCWNGNDQSWVLAA
ncbi:MAG: DUF3577 domain-containing protein [Thiotrichaceae bacterium]|nr:DUF3577 domain-containing protein [Thiotrichaceae bacterium]